MPHTPSMVERSTPKSFSMRANRRRVFFRLLPAGDDAPVGDAAVEILPELFVEFGLVADGLEPGHVGLYPDHDARVGLVGDATRFGLGAERADPLLKRWLFDVFCERSLRVRSREYQRGNAARDGF